MMLKMKSFGLLAGCALATGSLYAATYSESFEGTIVTTPATWGDVTATVSNYTYSATGSVQPLTGEHTKVLLIEGEATRTAEANTFTGTPVVDMMVQTARPDDELEIPEGGDPVHIAVAVDSNGCFNAYCKKKTTGEVGWCKLSDTVYDDSAWVRVSLLFDYSKSRCQVRIDGQPMMTADGYLTVDETTATGAWYELALGETTATSISSLKIVGCTAVDDVVMNNESNYEYPLAANAKVEDVPCAWFDQYGLAWTATATYGGSSMTIGEKYARCFDPFAADQVFELKSLATTQEKVVLGLPETVETLGREVVLDYSADKEFALNVTTSTNVTGLTSVEINLPSTDGAIYYRLRAKDK